MSIQCPVNAISNANLKCKFPMQISNANFLYKPMQFPLHTCSQNKYTGAARQRRGKSFASSRPARCIGGVLPSTARPPLAQLQDAPVQFQTAPAQCCPGCPVLSSTALTKAASAVKGRAPTSTSTLPMGPDQQQQGALHLLHHDQQQQGDLGSKCSQAANNGHHFKAAAPET